MKLLKSNKKKGIKDKKNSLSQIYRFIDSKTKYY